MTSHQAPGAADVSPSSRYPHTVNTEAPGFDIQLCHLPVA